MAFQPGDSSPSGSSSGGGGGGGGWASRRFFLAMVGLPGRLEQRSAYHTPRQHPTPPLFVSGSARRANGIACTSALLYTTRPPAIVYVTCVTFSNGSPSYSTRSAALPF